MANSATINRVIIRGYSYDKYKHKGRLKQCLINKQLLVLRINKFYVSKSCSGREIFIIRELLPDLFLLNK